jgi:hypothetical protein
VGYGGRPQTNQEREWVQSARSIDRERDLAHVADLAPGQEAKPGLFARIMEAVRRRRSPRRY